ncbi:hypothetical protein D3C73_1382390 [compost metagenome]
MPIIVIKNLFLYLSIFLAVTLLVKDILPHIKPTRSNSILFPALGVLGLISTAGTAINSLAQAKIAASVVHKTATIVEVTANSTLKGDIMSGISYIIL